MFSWEIEVVFRFLHLRSTAADEAILELCSVLPVDRLCRCRHSVLLISLLPDISLLSISGYPYLVSSYSEPSPVYDTRCGPSL